MSSLADPTFIEELEKGLQSDSTDQLKTLIETHGKAFLKRVIAFNINERSTPLTFATVTPSSPPKIVEFLVSQDKNLVNLSKDPPFECGALHFASMSDSRYQKAKIMLENGAFVNAIDNQGNTPFHHACNYGAHRIARLLLQYEANPTIRNNKDETAYGIAQDHQDPYVVAAIIKEIQKYSETIEEDEEEEEERESRENILKNQMDIGDIRKELMDMLRTIASLKKNDDEKDDKITSLQRQNNKLASEIKQLKENQTKLADDVKRIPELEQEMSNFKTIVNELTAKLQSKETERNSLTKRQESFESIVTSSRGTINGNQTKLAEIQEHQLKHETTIRENTTNIQMNSSKVEKLERSARSQNNAIKEHTEVIKSILTSSRQIYESREVVLCPDCPLIPLFVEEFKDESLTDASPRDQCNNPPENCDNQNGNVPETKPFDVVRSKDRMDSSKDKIKCSEDTSDTKKDNTECHVDTVLLPEDKSKQKNGTASTSETVLKIVWECDNTIPKRFAYDDGQLNFRSGFVTGAAEFRSSRSRRWSGDTNRIRECVTMTGRRYMEDHRHFDIMDGFRDGTIKRRKRIEIKTVERAIRSLSSLDSCCPPASTPDSSVTEEESEDC